ncbi:MAG: DUF4058 family protein [Chloroflexota bacterium]
MKFDHNIFPGINPYQHSKLLKRGWPGFHLEQTVEMTRALRRKLVAMGMKYNASIHHGLQFKEIQEIPLPYREMCPCIHIHEVDEWQKPLVWIELLTPNNKPPHAAFEEYAQARRDLPAEIVFVEIDYIHSQPTTLGAPAYADGGEDARPYHVHILDRQCSIEEFHLHYESDVMEPLPTIPVPLPGNESVYLDLNLTYNRGFEEMFNWHFLDYADAADELLGYHAADVEAIAAHVKAAERT